MIVFNEIGLNIHIIFMKSDWTGILYCLTSLDLHILTHTYLLNTQYKRLQRLGLFPNNIHNIRILVTSTLRLILYTIINLRVSVNSQHQLTAILYRLTSLDLHILTHTYILDTSHLYTALNIYTIINLRVSMTSALLLRALLLLSSFILHMF